MTTTHRPRLPLLQWLSMLLVLLLIGACVPQNSAQTLVVSPLGTVVVGPGEDIHIRTLTVLTSIGDLGVSTQRAVAMALTDYGPIKGHNVTMGAGLDSLCTPEGGAAGAETVIGDPRVVGVIGTSCSAAAVKASPILSEAGLVLISPTNTAPSLTSDLRGNAGPDYHRGYYRTANNDLHEAEAVAEFAYVDLGLRSMAVIQDGDPYTSGLANAFSAAFELLGGSVAAAMVNKGDTDMIPVLTQIAAGGPDGLFLPLFPDEGIQVIQQIGQVAGFEESTIIGGTRRCWISRSSPYRSRKAFISPARNCTSGTTSTKQPARAETISSAPIRRSTMRRPRRSTWPTPTTPPPFSCMPSRRSRLPVATAFTSTAPVCVRR